MVTLAYKRHEREHGRSELREDQVMGRAEAVERALEEWRPEIRAGLGSSALMENVATQTMWREASSIIRVLRL